MNNEVTKSYTVSNIAVLLDVIYCIDYMEN